MPSWVPESKRTVYPVLGSVELGAQVRRLAPDIHVYGHSHVNQIIKIDSTHYVNNAFATPRRRVLPRNSFVVFTTAKTAKLFHV